MVIYTLTLQNSQLLYIVNKIIGCCVMLIYIGLPFCDI